MTHFTSAVRTTAFVLFVCAIVPAVQGGAQNDDQPRSRTPDGDEAHAEPFEVTIPTSLLDERGAWSIWFKSDERLDGPGEKRNLLDSEAFACWLDPREGQVWLLVHVNEAMRGRHRDEEPKLYWMGAPLTHVKADRWYHLAFTWDARDADRNTIYLDGIRQGDGPPYVYPGQIKSADADVRFEVGSRGVSVGDLRVLEDAPGEAQLRAELERCGHQPYTDEGLRFSGETFLPDDVDWAHPVYMCDFNRESDARDWTLEGGRAVRVLDGNLVLDNGPFPLPADTEPRHLVCWLKREVPADFLLEFTVRPDNRRRGLNIVFFNARGVDGQSIFESALAPRDGTFSQYTREDVDSYHASYWAGLRGTANLRKNSGFQLVAVGKDLVGDARPGAFQTVRVYKHGGRIRVMVDDVVSVAFDDDGKTWGPVHQHSGWIGLRQMAHTHRCAYGHVKIWPLTDPPKE